MMSFNGIEGGPDEGVLFEQLLPLQNSRNIKRRRRVRVRIRLLSSFVLGFITTRV